MNFFDTVGGRRFVEGTIPKGIRALESIAKELKRGNDLSEKKIIQMNPYYETVKAILGSSGYDFTDKDVQTICSRLEEDIIIHSAFMDRCNEYINELFGEHRAIYFCERCEKEFKSRELVEGAEFSLCPNKCPNHELIDITEPEVKKEYFSKTDEE
ncbi:hypothetical protein J2S74_002930 [Evansella vedderi]|uniref:Uncharacterized protein n=1 Tax=Evansella vedderi TaxID=38282 RepID=A0ABT9ZYM2_9BACI|nr:hypothetical protein [Evansella vedderi]MDQ0255548.1 hypothetical protein [Evansella vedderi]